MHAKLATGAEGRRFAALPPKRLPSLIASIEMSSPPPVPAVLQRCNPDILRADSDGGAGPPELPHGAGRSLARRLHPAATGGSGFRRMMTAIRGPPAPTPAIAEEPEGALNPDALNPRALNLAGISAGSVPSADSAPTADGGRWGSPGALSPRRHAAQGWLKRVFSRHHEHDAARDVAGRAIGEPAAQQPSTAGGGRKMSSKRVLAARQRLEGGLP